MGRSLVLALVLGVCKASVPQPDVVAPLPESRAIGAERLMDDVAELASDA